ncbi:MAG: YdcF family protein [Roseovarius sp.]
MKTDDTPRPAAALVLGAKVLEDGRPSAALERRALHAAGLYRDGVVARIIASGGPSGARVTEAEAIRRLCLSAGVPEAAILLEAEAANTEENIRLARPVLDAAGIGAVWLVTDGFHARRAAFTARRQGLEVTMSCPALTGVPLWRRARMQVRERAALAVYAVRLWRGS